MSCIQIADEKVVLYLGTSSLIEIASTQNYTYIPDRLLHGVLSHEAFQSANEHEEDILPHITI